MNEAIDHDVVSTVLILWRCGDFERGKSGRIDSAEDAGNTATRLVVFRLDLQFRQRSKSGEKSGKISFMNMPV